MECKINGLNIEYEIIGKGIPLLILHKSMIGHMENLFTEDHKFKRIYLNYPGIGLSEVTGLTSSDDVLEVILEFINIYIKEEPFLLFGHSYSTYLARAILKRKQNQVTGIGMSCPLLEADMTKRKIPKDKQEFIDEDFLSTLDEDDKTNLSYMVTQNKTVLSRIKNYAEHSTTMNIEFYNHLKESGRYGFSYPIDNLDTPFDKPTLIILGRHDYVVGFEEGLNLINNYTRSTIALLDQVGHSPFFENKSLFDSLVLDWLNRVS